MTISGARLLCTVHWRVRLVTVLALIQSLFHALSNRGAAGSSEGAGILDCCTSQADRPRKNDIASGQGEALNLYRATVQGDEKLVEYLPQICTLAPPVCRLANKHCLADLLAVSG